MDPSSPDLLRVIRKGPAVKRAVDDAIDRCSTVLNLRDAIDDSRVRAEAAPDERQSRLHASKGMVSFCHYLSDSCYIVSLGLQNLRRYFELIVFQSYLQSTEPDTMQSFESVEAFVKNRPGW